jgi:hypothetical protein
MVLDTPRIIEKLTNKNDKYISRIKNIEIINSIMLEE